MIGPDPLRVLMLWCPDWPVLAVQLTQGVPHDAPLALVDRGLVVARSAAAAAEGVETGLRIRQAQHRCPDLIVLPHDPIAEARAFEPMLHAVEEKIPDVQVIRPGLAAVRAKGAARFYGGEESAARALLDHVRSHAKGELRLSVDLRGAVADGFFTAEHAAYATTPGRPIRLIPPGASTHFLAGLSVTTVSDKRTANLLQRMGIRTLRDLADLPREQVHARFGAAGLHAHQLAHGEDSPTLSPRTLPPDLGMSVTFDPPAVHLEQIVAQCEPAATGFVETLTRASLICTEIRVTVQVEPGTLLEQQWRHPWQFGRAEVLDRVRWQLEDLAADAVTVDDDGLPAAVLAVHVMPESLDSTAHHATALWGDRPDEKVEHALTGLQHRLGHEGVLTSAVAGGRLLHERRVLRPWGDALPTTRERRLEQPWPGTVPGPAPPTVFSQARQAQVTTEHGAPITVDDRGGVSGAPAWLHLPDDGRRRITAWAGPWPVRQRWWRKQRDINRFQLIDNQSTAWLALTEGSSWWIEARYD
ncbi:DNA polymerase Y family protein [Flexivirga meconopsidis]|uniref:DNA polymerase Y family protein n=1 Tax=Flexivirga meconopsidis TaxID=2977121 RepID=UPI002240DCD6|nr:DNA polymerase Y family protein [Flexivirga meconopsidis]